MENFLKNIKLASEKHTWIALPLDAWLRGVAVLVNALLVVGLARVLAGLTATILWGPSLLSGGATGIMTQGVAARDTGVVQRADVASIGAWHLFGRNEAPAPVAAPPMPVAVAPLNLRLVGVFFAEQRTDKALALIAEGTGVERGYRIGEALPGGARLEQVQRDRVIVSRGNQQEVLNLPRLEETQRAPTVEGLPPAEPIIEPPAEPAQPEIPQEQPSSSREPQLIDATAVAARLRGAAGPQALEDIAFASPYVQEGRFLGFRLRPGRDRQLLQQIGLTSGDVITEVNGHRLDGPMRGLASLRELQHADQIKVRVLRNGAEIPLAFSLGRPAAVR